MFTEYDGNPLSVTPMWNQNQPDNVNESCVQLNGYGWDDDNCIKQRPVICQMRMCKFFVYSNVISLLAPEKQTLCSQKIIQ